MELPREREGGGSSKIGAELADSADAKIVRLRD